MQNVFKLDELIPRIELSPEEDVAMLELARSPFQSTHLVYMPPGRKIRPHYHRERDEVYVILGGRARLRIGDELFEVGRGYVAYVPRGTVHAAESIGADPLVLVFVSAPPYDPKRDRYYVD